MQSTHRRLQDSPPNTLEVEGAGDANGTYYFAPEDSSWELDSDKPNKKACPFFCYETHFDIHRSDDQDCWFIMDGEDNTCYRNDDYSQNALTPPASGWTLVQDDAVDFVKRFCDPVVTSYFVEATSYGATRRRLTRSALPARSWSTSKYPTPLKRVIVTNAGTDEANGTYTRTEEHGKYYLINKETNFKITQYVEDEDKSIIPWYISGPEDDLYYVNYNSEALYYAPPTDGRWTNQNPADNTNGDCENCQTRNRREKMKGSGRKRKGTGKCKSCGEDWLPFIGETVESEMCECVGTYWCAIVGNGCSKCKGHYGRTSTMPKLECIFQTKAEYADRGLPDDECFSSDVDGSSS